MILTIDGPAGAGKSSVAREVAARLGFRFLDTGAMYRAVAWAALERGIDLHNFAAVDDLCASLRIELTETAVLIDGRDVSTAIRAPEVTRLVGAVADNQRVRARLIEWQREFAKQGNVVSEGRDQGTVAFPHAECKVFLTASPEERARRRYEELIARGIAADYHRVLDDQNKRDADDAARPVGRLEPAADAIVVNTDGLLFEEVVERLVALAREKMN